MSTTSGQGPSTQTPPANSQAAGAPPLSVVIPTGGVPPPPPLYSPGGTLIPPSIAHVCTAGQIPLAPPVCTAGQIPVCTAGQIPVCTAGQIPVCIAGQVPLQPPASTQSAPPVCIAGTSTGGVPLTVNSNINIPNQTYVNHSSANVPSGSSQSGQSLYEIPDPLKNDLVFLRDYHTLVAQHIARGIQMSSMLNQSSNSLNVSTIPCPNTATTQSLVQPLSSSALAPSIIPTQKMAKKVALLTSTYQPFDAKEDPEFWMDNLLAHASSEGLDFKNIIDNIRPFFEKSPDKSVKSWFEAYRNCIREQSRKQMTPYDIWLALKKQLCERFNLAKQAEKASEELVIYRYSNEDANDYISKITTLVRKVKGDADDDEIVKNLYSHLPPEINAITNIGIQFHVEFSVSQFHSQSFLCVAKFHIPIPNPVIPFWHSTFQIFIHSSVFCIPNFNPHCFPF